ncbi:MAG: hypothetical protein IV094_09235 [Vitreoscilla sp.]|nr:hypothetical protein [Vitreoscilla sp.]
MSTSTHSSPFTRRRVSAALLAALFILGSGGAMAQAEPDAVRMAPQQQSEQRFDMSSPTKPGFGRTACPHPISGVRELNSGPGTPVMSDFPSQYQSGGLHGGLQGSVIGQTQTDKWFGHTFEFKPSGGKCCSYNPGKLTVVYKSLTNGPNNDGSYVVHNGQVVNFSPTAQYIWPGQTATLGQTITKVFAVPPGIMASGQVSFMAQDDTAVLSARLEGTGCCVEPTPVQ